jgi:hypothetical protein
MNLGGRDIKGICVDAHEAKLQLPLALYKRNLSSALTDCAGQQQIMVFFFYVGFFLRLSFL